MHRSALRELTIDCNTDDLESAATFWSEVLGRRKRAGTGSAAGYYVLETGPGELEINIQRVRHPSRVHLDLATDDLEAEVARLEGLGARRLERVRHWWVMEAPTGHRFCVVESPPERMTEDGHVWD